MEVFYLFFLLGMRYGMGLYDVLVFGSLCGLIIGISLANFHLWDCVSVNGLVIHACGVLYGIWSQMFEVFDVYVIWAS